MSAQVQPIGADEAGRLFNGLDRPLALAVSGGADSMALMHLVAAWRRNGGGAGTPAPLVLSVDHGLRAASGEEAEFVAVTARRLGFLHETVTWTGTKPTSGIQDAARRARYDLMLQRLAGDAERRDLLLAHHLEDQAETLLMRLARGSGIDGLSGMRPVEHRVAVIGGAPMREVVIRLRRPLLSEPKRRLVATLEALGADWREDPSNADVRFERVRLRRAQAMLAELGLGPDSVARSARRLALERSVLIDRTRALAASHVRDHGGSHGEFHLPDLRLWLAADVTRILSRLLDVFGGTSPPPQLSQLETLTERLLSPSPSAVGRLSLGGCLVEIAAAGPGGRQVVVYREPQRVVLPSVMLQPGEGVFWDRRFYISVAAKAQSAVLIGPCGPVIPAMEPFAVPREAHFALPAVLAGDAATPLWPTAEAPVSCDWPMQHARYVAWRDADWMSEATI